MEKFSKWLLIVSFVTVSLISARLVQAAPPFSSLVCDNARACDAIRRIPAGPRGPTGPRGPAGPTGPRGSVGPEGPADNVYFVPSGPLTAENYLCSPGFVAAMDSYANRPLTALETAYIQNNAFCFKRSGIVEPLSCSTIGDVEVKTSQDISSDRNGGWIANGTGWVTNGGHTFSVKLYNANEGSSSGFREVPVYRYIVCALSSRLFPH
ncbi:MAG: hypothetical protein Q7T03_05235 [Deltaproteobacteria bacterium]|nr:hypothetical protein [Deltaproteobacteria bacterium]